jgi:hypothetical protein
MVPITYTLDILAETDPVVPIAAIDLKHALTIPSSRRSETSSPRVVSYLNNTVGLFGGPPRINHIQLVIVIRLIIAP